MNKNYLPLNAKKPIFCALLWVVCLFTGTVATNAQQTRSQARETEWKNYALPQTNFARQLSPEKEILFRIPADWKEEVPGTFVGPHSAKIILQVNKIPDGYPFQQYFSSVLKGIRDLPGGADGTVTRKTQFQDLEAREIFLDLPDEEGELQRRVLWLTTSGPLAIAFHFHVPAAHAAATEPYFKAVVQSVIFLRIDYPGFETLRNNAIKTPAPGPIHEVESIVATLNGANVNRESAITRLTSLFSSHPDVVVDLLLDRRPFVRAAAVRALAQSNNSALAPLLWNMVDDQELIVAEVAARAVASSPDIVAKTLQNSFGGVRTEIIARVWPFLAKEKRHELLQKMFSETAVAPPPPPKPAAKNAEQHKVEVIVSDIEPVKPGRPVADVIFSDSKSPIVQRGALTLLSSLPAEEFKLPLARLMASKYDSLIGLGLEVANDRAESLPVESLFKLVASSDHQVSKLAAQSFGFSAAVTDIPKIEALISKDSSRKDLNDELKNSIKKIRFRHELSTAKGAGESREIIRKALSDSSIADFAWRYDCENTTAGCTPSSNNLKTDFAVKPFGENLFPKRVKHYTSIPKPGQAVQKFYESLNGLQMETPRAQANLILMMGFLRQQMLRSASAPIDAETLIEYTGIDPDSPIAATAWTAEGAFDQTNSAERKAIVMRVKDRARFERTIEQFQDTFGPFIDLTDYLAMGTRGIAALPAIIPFSVQAVPSFDPSKQSLKPVLTYNFSRDQEFNGIRIKTIEHRTVHSDWTFSTAATHIAFLGDTAILTSDIASLRELLDKSDRLSGNEAFSKAVQLSGDIIYFSDVEAVMAEAAATTKNADFKISESGSLNIAGPSWENTHQLLFKESDWAKPLLPFDPKELVAPRELLPASTIAYYLMRVDPVNFWHSQLRTSFISNEQLAKVKLWSMDFEKEVLPELGPECGAVLLELPDMELNGTTWAVFCSLKSSKLAHVLGAGPAREFVEVKFEDTSGFVAVRNGFLILSNRSNGITAFDGKSSLATTRDYSRAVKKAPSGIVAFGGYNLEAAIAAATRKPLEGPQAEVAKVLTSIASAFHSQSFYATATAGSIEARSSVAMDREGRYPIADFSYLPRGTNITFVTLDPSGVPITDQKRLSSLTLKIRAKAAGPIDNIKDDVKTAEQSVEQKSPNELLVTVAARRSDPEKPIELPIKDPQFAEFLKATTGIAADNAAIKEQARQIAGNDRDAWSVARKLADWTYQNLEWKQVANASAEDTLATREADCSEFSQLFVSMARSLGLPARMVSGLAYSGNSFGGHAWVEVWVGKWIELDPTWGTHFVDATHIRNNSDTLTTSAALNLIELEVLETKRTVADFQKSSKALMQHLVKAIPAGDKSDLEATLDLALLTDQAMGEGGWSKMSEAEREQMWSGYRRLLSEIISGYAGSGYGQSKMRVLHLEEKDNVANVTALLEPLLYLKLQLVRRNDAWYLAEIVQGDTAFRTVYETLRPAIAGIEKARSGDKTASAALSDYVRVILLLDKNPEKAVTSADAALKNNPGDQRLRYLKGLALQDLEKLDEAEKVMRELANENFASAIYRLGDHLSTQEEETKVKEAIVLYERYATLEPYDSRVFLDLALTYLKAGDPVKAEAAHRRVIELNPGDSDGYLEFIVFLSVQDKLSEVGAVLAAYDKNKDSDNDLFAQSFSSLYFAEEPRAAEKLAAAEPVRFKANAVANFYLGKINFDEGKYVAALNFLKASAQLDPKYTGPHIVMAQVHRKQSRWAAALKAAQHAISLDEEDSEGHYEQACALARMGRLKAAMTSLEKAVELDPDLTTYLNEEADLKPLASLPAFKKFIPVPEKQD